MSKNKKAIILFFIILFIFFVSFIYNKTVNLTLNKKITNINLEEVSVALLLKHTTEITETTTEMISSSTEQTTQVYYNESYIPYIKIDKDCKIYSYMEFKGEEYDYALFGIAYNENKNFDEDCDKDDFDFKKSIYEDEEFSYNKIVYWEIVVLKNNSVVTVLRNYKDDYGDIFNDETKNMLFEKDVNFDGKNDILLFQGHFGTQGALKYSCFLQTKNKFELCESFSEILNPIIDHDNNIIFIYWRNYAVSHSIGKYYFINGKFILKEILTEEPEKDYSEYDEIKWSYRLEEFSNGKWVEKDYFTEENFKDSEIGTNSIWDIGRDGCENLYKENY